MYQLQHSSILYTLSVHVIHTSSVFPQAGMENTMDKMKPI